MLSRVPSANSERDEHEPSNAQLHAIELFALEADDNTNEDGFPLALKRVLNEQQKELSKGKSKIKALLDKKQSGYEICDFEGHALIMHEGKIYVPESLRGRTLEWYHHYLNHPGGDRLANTLLQVCYWKGLTHQAKQYAKACQQCQKFKRRKTRYGHLPPKEIGDLKPWQTVHVDLIGPYTVTAKQYQPGNKIVVTELKLTCMTFIDPATGWFEIAEIPTFDLDLIKIGNKEYIDKSSARVSQIFNNTWLCRYPRPVEVVYDNGSEFKKDFQPLIKDFDIKPNCTTVENPQANAPVERVHQVIQNMIRTKDLTNRIFDYIDPWGEILSSIAWAIRASYHSTLGATPAQLVFGRDMIFNLKAIVDWRTITARKQKQVIKDNIRENKGRIDHQYSIGDKIYLRPTGIQRKLEIHNKGPYRITHVYTNGTVRIQIGARNDKVNIRRIEPAFERE